MSSTSPPKIILTIVVLAFYQKGTPICDPSGKVTIIVIFNVSELENFRPCHDNLCVLGILLHWIFDLLLKYCIVQTKSWQTYHTLANGSHIVNSLHITVATCIHVNKYTDGISYLYFTLLGRHWVNKAETALNHFLRLVIGKGEDDTPHVIDQPKSNCVQRCLVVAMVNWRAGNEHKRYHLD